jgi:hypothetical protein
MTALVLTPDQQSALDGIINFIYNDPENCAVLYAAAGCGKTFLTQVIANKVRGTHRVAGVAPTHKARKVLDKFLNKGSLIKIKTLTVASLLNTMRGHSYIGTKRYERGQDTKMTLFDLFLIDEASMITDTDVDLIMNYAVEFKRKILFIGDKYQIPNPSQKYKLNNGIATKRDSKAFELTKSFELTTIVRQREGNPIVNVYKEIRDAINEGREPEYEYKTNVVNNCGVQFYNKQDEWYAKIKNVFLILTENKEPLHLTRIIAYTNENVKNHNLMIRRLYKRGQGPEIGELLMGYANIGWPVPVIENGQDYYVQDVIHTTIHTVPGAGSLAFKRLVGDLVTLTEPDDEKGRTVFVPDISAAENNELLQELIERGELVNRNRSTKNDFKRYAEIKNKLVFMENVYKFNGEILGEEQFRGSNPLLFKSVEDVIEDKDEGDRNILENDLVNDIIKKYGNILTTRADDDKPLTKSERLCDRYCVIEKDLDYGYCITAHKSQGSNFKRVFIDEVDFDKIKSHWSYAFDCKIDGSKERNQLKYVAFTRPSDIAHVYYKRTVNF